MINYGYLEMYYEGGNGYKHCEVGRGTTGTSIVKEISATGSVKGAL
jgi:hypothetical protein